jgi:hypothetical protein
LAAVVAVACAACVGCQRIVEVTGTVLVDGKPGRGLVVIFDPAVKDEPRGVASTDARGGYALRRLGPGNKTGVPAGTYSVKIMADVDDPNAVHIPDRYFRSSELTCDVQGGKPNVYDIKISTK